MRAVTSTRLVGLTLLSVVLGLLAGRGPAVDASSRSEVEAGDLVVADQEAGEVLRISPDGDSDVVLDGLRAVRAVVVLPDGAVLAADSDAGVVVGTGGRYGEERVEVAAGLESPEAIARGGGGRLYVTSFSEGTLSQVDLTNGRVEALAAALDGPSAVVALRPPRDRTEVAVAEWFGGTVAVLQRNGERSSTLTQGLDRPAGLATDGDGTVYITDRGAGRILAVSPTGRTRVVAEVDAPAGIALDPAEHAAGQAYDLVVTTATGIERVDARTGEADTLSDIETAVGVAVAPDELVAAGEAASTPVAESAGGAGERAATDPEDTEVDPVMVALVAVAVFLAGVALITGIQLVRGRGREAEASGAAAATGAASPGRRERRRAEKRARADAKAEAARIEEAAEAARVQAKVDAKADAMAARDDDARAKAAAKAERRATKAQARAGAKSDKRAAKEEHRSRGGDEAEARSAPATETAPSAAGGPATAAVAAGDDSAPAAGVDPSNASPGDAPAADPRVPLFSAPAAPPLTAGPFLESLFAGEPPIDAGAADVPVADPGRAPTSAWPDPGPPVAAPAVPAAGGPAGATGPAALEPVGGGPGLGVELTEQVARDVPPPHGLFGRRRAKRRHTEAERRHRRLLALNALVDVAPPALPPAPVRPALGVASAASVAYPVDNPTPAALTAPRGDNGAAAGPPATGPAESVSVPWPGEGVASSGPVPPAWPSEKSR